MVDYRYGVILRPIEKDDLTIFLTERNRSETRRWNRQRGLLSMKDQLDWFEEQHDRDDTFMFSIAREHSRETMGYTGLSNIDWRHSKGEFSIMVLEKHRRRGVATKALKTLFTFGFIELNLNRIWGETLSGNPGTEIYKKLGLRYEGTLLGSYYKNGKFTNSQIYALTKDEYGERCDWKVQP